MEKVLYIVKRVFDSDRRYSVGEKIEEQKGKLFASWVRLGFIEVFSKESENKEVVITHNKSASLNESIIKNVLKLKKFESEVVALNSLLLSKDEAIATILEDKENIKDAIGRKHVEILKLRSNTDVIKADLTVMECVTPVAPKVAPIGEVIEVVAPIKKDIVVEEVPVEGVPIDKVSHVVAPVEESNIEESNIEESKVSTNKGKGSKKKNKGKSNSWSK